MKTVYSKCPNCIYIPERKGVSGYACATTNNHYRTYRSAHNLDPEQLTMAIELMEEVLYGRT